MKLSTYRASKYYHKIIGRHHLLEGGDADQDITEEVARLERVATVAQCCLESLECVFLTHEIDEINIRWIRDKVNDALKELEE